MHRSPWPDVVVPRVTLTELVLADAASHGGHPALVDAITGHTLTFRELLDHVRKLTAGLHRWGIRKGDVVALYLPNMPEYAVIFHAVASLGAVNTTVNPAYTAEEVRWQVADSRARMVFTTRSQLDVVRDATPFGQDVEIVTVDVGEGVLALADLLVDVDPPVVHIDPDRDLVALPYSSGTTGLPKGVMLTHRNLVANLTQIQVAEADAPSPAFMAVLPFFHIYGMVVIMNLGLLRGTTIVTMPRFEIDTFLKAVAKWQVALLHVVPPIVLALARHPAVDDHDLRAVRWLFSGAAPLGHEVTSAVEARIGCKVRQGYGMTEASPGTHFTPVGRERPGRVGPLLPSTYGRIVDPDTGRDVAPGEPGEVWVKGPQVMLGYLNNPEATARTVDADGWLHTGDIGVVDEHGWLTVLDRLKELIKYKGYQVAPAELEALLLKHPDVADAAVIPQPDEDAGEVPKAFIVARGALDPGALMAWVAEHVSPHKRVRAVEIVESIPKSASGKILRRLLIERDRAAK